MGFISWSEAFNPIPIAEPVAPEKPEVPEKTNVGTLPYPLPPDAATEAEEASRGLGLGGTAWYTGMATDPQFQTDPIGYYFKFASSRDNYDLAMAHMGTGQSLGGGTWGTAQAERFPEKYMPTPGPVQGGTVGATLGGGLSAVQQAWNTAPPETRRPYNAPEEYYAKPYDILAHPEFSYTDKYKIAQLKKEWATELAGGAQFGERERNVYNLTMGGTMERKQINSLGISEPNAVWDERESKGWEIYDITVSQDNKILYSERPKDLNTLVVYDKKEIRLGDLPGYAGGFTGALAYMGDDAKGNPQYRKVDWNRRDLTGTFAYDPDNGSVSKLRPGWMTPQFATPEQQYWVGPEALGQAKARVGSEFYRGTRIPAQFTIEDIMATNPTKKDWTPVEIQEAARQLSWEMGQTGGFELPGLTLAQTGKPMSGSWEGAFADKQGLYSFTKDGQYIFTDIKNNKTALGKWEGTTLGGRFIEGTVKNGKFIEGVWAKEQNTEGRWVDTGKFVEGKWNETTGNFEPKDAQSQGFLGWILEKMMVPVTAIESARLQEEKRGDKFGWKYFPLQFFVEKALWPDFVMAEKIGVSDLSGPRWIEKVTAKNIALRELLKPGEDKQLFGEYIEAPFANAAAQLNKLEVNKGFKFSQDDYWKLTQFTPLYRPDRQPYIEMLTPDTIDRVLEQYTKDHPAEAFVTQMYTNMLFDPLNILMFLNGPITGVKIVPITAKAVGAAKVIPTVSGAAKIIPAVAKPAYTFALEVGIKAEPFGQITRLLQWRAAQKFLMPITPEAYAKIGKVGADLARPITNIAWLDKVLGPVKTIVGLGAKTEFGIRGKAAMHSQTFYKVAMTLLGGEDASKLQRVLLDLGATDEVARMTNLGYLGATEAGRVASDLAPDVAKQIINNKTKAGLWDKILKTPIMDEATWKGMSKAEQRANGLTLFSEMERTQAALDFLKAEGEVAAQLRYGLKEAASLRDVWRGKAKIKDALTYYKVLTWFNHQQSRIFLSTPRFALRNAMNNIATAIFDGILPFSSTALISEFNIRNGFIPTNWGWTMAEFGIPARQGLSKNPLQFFQSLSAKFEGNARQQIWYAGASKAMRQVSRGVTNDFPIIANQTSDEIRALMAKVQAIHEGGGAAKDIAALKLRPGQGANDLTAQFFMDIPEDTSAQLVNTINERLAGVTGRKQWGDVRFNLEDEILSDINPSRETIGLPKLAREDYSNLEYEALKSQMMGADSKIAWVEALRAQQFDDEYVILAKSFDERLRNWGISDDVLKGFEASKQQILDETYWNKYSLNPDKLGAETTRYYNKEIPSQQFYRERAIAWNDTRGKIISFYENNIQRAKETAKLNTSAVEQLVDSWKQVERTPQAGEVLRVEYNGRVYTGKVREVKTVGGIERAYPEGSWKIENPRTGANTRTVIGVPLTPPNKRGIPKIGTSEYDMWFGNLGAKEKAREQIRRSKLEAKWFEPILKTDAPYAEQISAATAKKIETMKSFRFIHDLTEQMRPFFERGGKIPQIAGLKQGEIDVVNKWLDQHAELDKTIKAYANEMGHNEADKALHDYSHYYDFDAGLKALFPWEFWLTRSGYKWMLRTLEKPYAVAAFTKFQEQAMHTTDSLLPERLKNKLALTIPGLSWLLPDWTEGTIYNDPLRQFLPLTDWMDTYIDPEMQQETFGAFNSIVQNNGLSISPVLSSILSKMGAFGVRRQKNWLPYIPPEELMIAISGGLPDMAGHPTLGLRARDPENWDYYVDRQLNNMLAANEIGKADADSAIQTREGAVFKEAEARAIKEYHLRRSVGVMTGFPLATFPEGERIHRERLLEKRTAQYQQSTGQDPLAMVKFYDKYPDEKFANYLFLEPDQRTAQIKYDNTMDRVKTLQLQADKDVQDSKISQAKWKDIRSQNFEAKANAFAEWSASIPLGKSEMPWVLATDKLNEIDRQEFLKEIGGRMLYDRAAREKARNDYLASIDPAVARIALIYEARNKTDYEKRVDAANIRISQLQEQLEPLQQQTDSLYEQASVMPTPTDIAKFMTEASRYYKNINININNASTETDEKVLVRTNGKLIELLGQWNDFYTLGKSLPTNTTWGQYWQARLNYLNTMINVLLLKQFP